MAKKYNKDFFKELKEKSAKIYESIPALNWGENKNNSYFVSNRYHFKWKNVIGDEKKLSEISIDIKDYILDFIKQNKKSVKIYLGTDSQNHLSFTRFVTVIVLYVEKNGAHVLVSRTDRPKIYDYRYRLLSEVDTTAELVRNLEPFFIENNLQFEIHSDFNQSTNHKSSNVVVEATNYLQHLGYNHKIKPEAFAASYGADYFC